MKVRLLSHFLDQLRLPSADPGRRAVTYNKLLRSAGRSERLQTKKVVELAAVAERLLAEQTARGQSRRRPASEEELDSLRALGYGGDDD